ncbi:DJ-1/PfpI family protein [uncultured Dokdonia sp.]|uniref:DJ-1/PfpI family protein n=1 Tax=uncultured Dokdonia sp. TaxID=575653 RepID=UPI00261BFBA2|nr:DJ-1/PfpI family protein [uncultured Dokdonia sp.]
MKNILILILVILSICSCNEEKTQPTNEQVKINTNIKTQDTNQTDTFSIEHDEVMKSVEIKDHEVKDIGILVYDGVNDLDALGPRYVFKNIMGANVFTIAVEPGNITTVMGLEFIPDTTIDKVSHLDILVIPGGFKETIENSYNQELLRWIRTIDTTTKYTTSVCTGGWILGKTGLLDGKRATGNWFRAKEILAENGATFTGDRYTQDGKYWTSAGVTAGMDMSLAILAELTGEDYAQAVMLDMEYDPAPPIVGGNVSKTKPHVLHFMKSMYGSIADPLFEALQKETRSRSDTLKKN